MLVVTFGKWLCVLGKAVAQKTFTNVESAVLSFASRYDTHFVHEIFTEFAYLMTYVWAKR